MKSHTFEKSGFIQSCSHDPEKNVLSITFQNGKTYHYGDCWHEDWENFVKADSPGKHFSSIKNNKSIITEAALKEYKKNS